MLVVVGGHTRNIGKTSVVAGLIAALPDLNWTAIKITQYGHSVCSSDGEPCECAMVDAEHPYAISEETEASHTDSGRFLAAGAKRSFWVRTAAGQLGYAFPGLTRIIEQSENAIVESNSILQFFKPDLFLAVLDFASEDFKKRACCIWTAPMRLSSYAGRGNGNPNGRAFPLSCGYLKKDLPCCRLSM